MGKFIKLHSQYQDAAFLINTDHIITVSQGDQFTTIWLNTDGSDTMQVNESFEEICRLLGVTDLCMRIKDCNLTNRTKNVCHSAGIETLKQLCEFSKYDLVKFPNCGRCSVDEIEGYLRERGLSLSAISHEHLGL